LLVFCTKKTDHGNECLFIILVFLHYMHVMIYRYACMHIYIYCLCSCVYCFVSAYMYVSLCVYNSYLCRPIPFSVQPRVHGVLINCLLHWGFMCALIERPSDSFGGLKSGMHLHLRTHTHTSTRKQPCTQTHTLTRT